MLATPLYGKNTIAEVLVSLRLALNNESNPLNLPGAKSAALVLIDGLGQLQIEQYAEIAPTLARLSCGEPLTTCFPATTPVSITSIGTGLPPAAHGILGTGTLRQGHRFHNTRWEFAQHEETLSPAIGQSQKTQFELAADCGIATVRIGKVKFDAGGLSRAALRGPSLYHVANTPGEILAATATYLKISGTLAYAYWDEVDYAAHVYGVGSSQYLEALAIADKAVAQLEQVMPQGALVMVTGDHGHLNLDIEQILDVSQFPDLKKGLRWLGGDLRARLVYAKGTQGDELAERWTARLQETYQIWTRADFLQGNPFGLPLSDVALEAMPALVVASLNRGGIIEKHRAKSMVKSDHGSLLPEEHWVPRITLQS